MTEEPPPQTGQAPAGVRDPAKAAEQADELDQLSLAAREGTPRGISTGLVLDLTLELFAECDAARERLERWSSLAGIDRPPSEFADPDEDRADRVRPPHQARPRAEQGRAQARQGRPAQQSQRVQVHPFDEKCERVCESYFGDGGSVYAPPPSDY